jgi:hypothetical protein
LADRSSSKRPESGAESPAGSSGSFDPDRPPGLGEQFGRTRSAVIGLIASHIELAKAEFSEIGGQLKRVVGLVLAAILLLLAALLMIFIGGPLFVGEVLFGSMGWGVLHGTELLLGMTVLSILAIVDLSWERGISALLVAVAVGIVVAGVLAVDWNWLSRQNQGMPSTVLVSVVACAVAIGLLGGALGSPFGRGVAGGCLFAGLIIGVLIGLLAAANPGFRVASAMGVVATLLFWPIIATVLAFRNGVDMDKVRKRFMPEQTIETTKETIEWVREQMPLGRKS